MDEELERARRAARLAPGDLSAAIRLASFLERSGEIGEAWRVFVEILAARKGSPWLEAHRELGALAGRHPAAILQELKARPGPLGVLFLRGNDFVPTHLPILVALGCDGSAMLARDRARHLLREPVGRAFGTFAPNVPLPEQVRESLGFIDPLPMHDDGDPFGPWRIIEKARKEKLLALAPWLLAMFDAPATALATDAKLCFQELTGQRDLPLDVEKLAAHWEKIKPRE